MFMQTIISTLEKLGQVLLECRKIPRDYFDYYGREHVDKGKDITKWSFFNTNPHSEGTLCNREWAGNPYNINAVILRIEYDKPRRNSRIDTSPVIVAKY